MRLSRTVIKNFRRIEEADIGLSNATFLIGQNSCGKSLVIRCLEPLLSTQRIYVFQCYCVDISNNFNMLREL